MLSRYLDTPALFQSTLPRGERPRSSARPARRHRFQSTLPRGERPSHARIFAVSREFQSTLPRGERRVPIRGTQKGYRSFNPRSHGGSDQHLYPHRRRGRVSIHAPTGGATHQSSPRRRRSNRFNPRSHGGSDPLFCGTSKPASCFNPRSHGGSDDVGPACRLVHRPFQSTLPRGERQPRQVAHYQRACVSIHAPTGGATRALMRRR